MSKKITKANAALTYSEQRVQDLSMGTRYRLRVEFRGDCDPIKAILGPWILTWYESDGCEDDDSYIDAKGKYWSSRNWGFNTDVQFIIKSGGPSLNEIRWLINTITDCHVAAQTVEPIETYNGERMDNNLLENSLVRPHKEMIQSALASIVRAKGIHKSRVEFFDEIEELIQAHMGNPVSYMKKEASRQAQIFIDNKNFTEKIELEKLVDFFFKNIIRIKRLDDASRQFGRIGLNHDDIAFGPCSNHVHVPDALLIP